MDDCIFCAIVSGDASASIVYADDVAVAFLGACGADIDNFLSIFLLRQEPLVLGAVPEQG